ncbi:MAG: GIDE domain-containing protein [Deltaproteobacteria bacterium]
MSNDRDIGYAAILFGAGIWFFFKGFKNLRRKRKIENIPTSTVRGLAMGLVELIGKSKKFSSIKSPLTGTECVFYRYTVERYQSSGRSGRWVTVAQGDSCACPFWLDDDTGRVLVFPKGAELIMTVAFQFETGLGKSIPENLTDFLEEKSISYKSFLGNYSLRFKEWRLCEDEAAYVMGTASVPGQEDFLDRHKEKLIRRLEELKGNREEMAKVDTNRDGEVSFEEWDLAVAKIEQELLEEELMPGQQQEKAEVIVTKGSKEEVFIISDYSQKDLLQRLGWRAAGGVFGGAALSLAMLWYLLFRLSVFHF